MTTPPQFEPLIIQALRNSGINPDVRCTAVRNTCEGFRQTMLQVRSGRMVDTTAGNIFRHAKYGIKPAIKIGRNARYRTRGASRKRSIEALDQSVAALQIPPNSMTWTSRNVQKTRTGGKTCKTRSTMAGGDILLDVQEYIWKFVKDKNNGQHNSGDSAEDPALQPVHRHNSEGNLSGMMKV